MRIFRSWISTGNQIQFWTSRDTLGFVNSEYQRLVLVEHFSALRRYEGFAELIDSVSPTASTLPSTSSNLPSGTASAEAPSPVFPVVAVPSANLSPAPDILSAEASPLSPSYNAIAEGSPPTGPASPTSSMQVRLLLSAFVQTKFENFSRHTSANALLILLVQQRAFDHHKEST